MKITLKLFASLSQFLPAGAEGNIIEVEVADAATPNQVIAQFQVPMEKVHLVLCNGAYVEVEQRDQHMLQANDELALWPPVAGG